VSISAIGILSKIMKEDFPSVVEDLVPFGTDPILNEVFISGAEVYNKMGRANASPVDTNVWEATHKIRMAPGGVLNWQSINRADVEDTSGISGRFLKTGASFPSALYATQSEYTEMGIPLAMCMGNVATNINTLRSLKNTDVIYDHVEGMIKDQTKLVKSHLQFAVYGDGSGRIAKISAVSGSGVDSPGESLVLTLDATEGAIRGFVRNMLVDLYNGTTLLNAHNSTPTIPVPLVVTKVDYQNRQITVALVGSIGTTTDLETSVATAISSGTAYVYLWNSYNNLPYGLEYFIKDSGTIFKLNLSNYPELKSKISGNGGTNRTLTAELLNQFLDEWSDQSIGEFPQILVSSRGVRSRFMKTRTDLNFQQVSPSAGDTVYDGGFKGTKYTYENQELKWFVSPYVRRKNSLYVINRKDLRLYAPTGVNKVNWFYSGGGINEANGIWNPVYNIDTVNNITLSSYLLEAPYSLFIQFATTAPQNLGRLDDLESLSDAI